MPPICVYFLNSRFVQILQRIYQKLVKHLFELKKNGSLTLIHVEQMSPINSIIMLFKN